MLEAILRHRLSPCVAGSAFCFLPCGRSHWCGPTCCRPEYNLRHRRILRACKAHLGRRRIALPRLSANLERLARHDPGHDRLGAYSLLVLAREPAEARRTCSWQCRGVAARTDCTECAARLDPQRAREEVTRCNGRFSSGMPPLFG